MSLANEKKKWFEKNKPKSHEEIFDAGYKAALKVLAENAEQTKDDLLEMAEQLISKSKAITYKFSKLKEGIDE